MSERSPTPDLLPRFQRARALDKAPKGVSGRDNRPQIVGNKLGPSCHLDSVSNRGQTDPALVDSTGGAAAARAGGIAPRVNWSSLRTAGNHPRKSR